MAFRRYCGSASASNHLFETAHVRNSISNKEMMFACTKRWGGALADDYKKDSLSFLVGVHIIAIVLVAVAVLLSNRLIVLAVCIYSASTLALGVAGRHGALRSMRDIGSKEERAVQKARVKRIAEILSSIGVGATILNSIIYSLSVQNRIHHFKILADYKDPLAMFVGLVFLPIYVSGAARKLAVARTDLFEAQAGFIRGSTAFWDKDKTKVIMIRLKNSKSGFSKIGVNDYRAFKFSPAIEELPPECLTETKNPTSI
jgi:hypothetical protein